MPISLDRDKIAKNALRFIQKGQFQKAIEEYRKVLSSDPRDIRTRLKLIDLYGRTGRKKEAIEECLQVAEAYGEQGFYLKAIAVYKQALRIDPENVSLYRNMGELYVKQGLVGDALAAFKKGVDVLRQGGQPGEAQALLARMEEMAPENAAIKVHLAELYLSEGKYKAFEEELSRIVLQLKGEGRTAKLLQALEGFYEKSNRHPSVLKRLAELYVDLHEEDKALQVVREGLSHNPADRDLRLLGLRANLTLGNLAEARRMAMSLHEEDPHDLFILEQLASIAQARGDNAELAHAYKVIAKIYERQGLQQKGDFYYRKVMEISPEDAEARLALGEVVVETAPPAPEPVLPEAESFWTGTEAPGPLAGDTVHEGLIEAELYLKYGLDDKAAEKLKELTRSAPDSIELRQKLRDLCQRKGDREGWVREQLQIGQLHLRQKRENEALRAYQAILEIDPDNVEAQKAVRYLKPEALPSRPPAVEIDIEGATIDLVTQDGEERAVRRPIAGDEGAEEALQQGLAAADFLEAQDRKDEAISLLRGLLGERPASPLIAARLQRLGWVGEAPQEEAPEEYVDLQTEVLDAHPGLGRGFAGFQEFEVSELDDIVREFRSGIAEKLDDADYETHYNLGLAYKEMGLLEDALQEFEIAARSPEKAREAYTSVALVYREAGRREEARGALRNALALASNTPQDRVAILYELGELAEEEGDREGALKAFERAAQLEPTYRDVTRRLRALGARGSG